MCADSANRLLLAAFSSTESGTLSNGGSTHRSRLGCTVSNLLKRVFLASDVSILPLGYSLAH